MKNITDKTWAYAQCAEGYYRENATGTPAEKLEQAIEWADKMVHRNNNSGGPFYDSAEWWTAEAFTRKRLTV